MCDMSNDEYNDCISIRCAYMHLYTVCIHVYTLHANIQCMHMYTMDMQVWNVHVHMKCAHMYSNSVRDAKMPQCYNTKTMTVVGGR